MAFSCKATTSATATPRSWPNAKAPSAADDLQDVVTGRLPPEDVARLAAARDRTVAECSSYKVIVQYVRSNNGRAM